MINKVYFGLFIMMCFGCSHPVVQKIKPNVIIIMSDDQGWGDLSLTGNPDINTPNIDRMARNGAFFDQFYVSPVCSPTRAELLTGRYHLRGGVYSTSQGGERLDLDEVTIAQIFKENEYKTSAFGKWHNGMQYPYHPNARGFDYFYGFCSGHWGNYFSPMLEENGKITKGDGFLTDDLTSRAIMEIEKNKNDPFFLYLPLNTPHSPMSVPQDWWESKENLKLSTTHSNKSQENIEKTKAAYALCENIDWNVGRLLDKVNELGLEENTIVIYLSDNGPNGWRWNNNLKGMKGHTDEGGVRSPFIIQWKDKIKEGREISQIASAMDVLPTLVEMCELDNRSKKNLDGISLKPLLIDEDANWPDRFIVSYWKEKISIRNQKYRMDADEKLYDMIVDPGQTTDVSRENNAVYQKMKTQKLEWKNEVLQELPKEDIRKFPLGHPDFIYNQVPARDGKEHGNITRSNRWPNCSYFTNWTSINDSITWDVNVVSDGEFEVTLYYTCPQGDQGSEIELSFNNNSLKAIIEEAYDPPFIGHEYDRIAREESLVKDFKPLEMGTIFLEKGEGKLALKANHLKGKTVADFRMLMLERIETHM